MHNELSILLIENDTANVEFILSCLQQKNISLPVFCVSTALDALTYLRKQQSSTSTNTVVALVDTQLPGTSGLDFLHEINQDPSLKNIIAFVVSSCPSPGERRMAHKEGAIGYFLKAEIPELVEILSDIV